jgi:hypothetical protein
LKKIDAKIENMDVKLQSLEALEKKVDSFENELKKIWLHVHDSTKSNDEKVMKIDERVQNVEFAVVDKDDQIEKLLNENIKMKDEVVYLKSQSMRNNLIFGGIKEEKNEKPEETERILRNHLKEKLNMAEEYVKSLQIERAHRMGVQGHDERSFCNRKIVCKFTYFKDREFVRSKRKLLEKTPYFLHEQFPPEVVQKRRSLFPKLKKAREENKTAWIAYDTLFVDGKPVKSA